jgi:actin-related protein 6
MVSKARAPAKQAAPKVQPLPEKTFIIDNGAYTIKAGYAPSKLPPPQNEEDALSACVTIPNALAKTRDNRVFVGAQLSTHISDWNEVVFRRPVEKGYIVNWEAQKEIWEQTFFDERTARNKETRISNPEETTLVLTDTPNGLPALQRNADEMIMEEWGFGGYARIVGELSHLSGCFSLSFKSKVRLIGNRIDDECMERHPLSFRRFYGKRWNRIGPG